MTSPNHATDHTTTNPPTENTANPSTCQTHTHKKHQNHIKKSAKSRYSHVPLTIFYSSLTKLFLLFLLSIWRPDGTESLNPDSSDSPSAKSKTRPLPAQYNATNMFSNPIILAALEILDEDHLDREWIVRNVLGGMAAGFGLRGESTKGSSSFFPSFASLFPCLCLVSLLPSLPRPSVSSDTSIPPQTTRHLSHLPFPHCSELCFQLKEQKS